MRLLVTRPEPDGERTAAKLRARGHEVMLAPLLRMEPVAGRSRRRPVARGGADQRQCVRAIAGHPRLEACSDSGYAVGGRTADAARAVGFENVISADGDARRPRAPDQGCICARGARVLYLAGEDRAAISAARSPPPASTCRDRGGLSCCRGVRAARGARGARGGPGRGVLHFSRRSAVIYLACAAAAGSSTRRLAPGIIACRRRWRSR